MMRHNRATRSVATLTTTLLMMTAHAAATAADNAADAADTSVALDEATESVIVTGTREANVKARDRTADPGHSGYRGL